MDRLSKTCLWLGSSAHSIPIKSFEHLLEQLHQVYWHPKLQGWSQHQFLGSYVGLEIDSSVNQVRLCLHQIGKYVSKLATEFQEFWGNANTRT